MRKLVAAAVLAILVATPVAAAPIDADQGRSITRVLEHVAVWWAKIWAGDPDDDDDGGPPPFDGVGPEWDPVG